MKEITDNKEIQKIELDVLEKIHAFCEKRGLRYSLCGGTLIGAVRHKGFIPWDDDVDIFMPRPDYKIFCKEFSAENCSVHTHGNDKKYLYPFAKVHDARTVLIEHFYPKNPLGVYVDVFPIDGFPNQDKSVKLAQRARSLIMRCVQLKQAPFIAHSKTCRVPLLRFFVKCFFACVPSKFFCDLFLRIVAMHDYETSPFRGCMTWGYGAREVIPAEAFDGFVEMDFEGRKFKAIAGWETYLKSLYGDYMQLPPPEKRVSNHDFTAYWKD